MSEEPDFKDYLARLEAAEPAYVTNVMSDYINRLRTHRKLLIAALRVEISGAACGDDCAGGGYSGCSGCERLAKDALSGNGIK